ncbi:MAG: serine/threonine-protein kinase [Polyangiales bacterium]
MTLQCSQCGSAIEEGARFCPLCGRPAALSAHGGDPWIGREVLGRYRVRSLIGEGGMGRVYLAEQRIGGVTRPVAIKTLIPGAGDATMATRFLRECETVATLQSPNTVQVYDFGVVDGALVLVMEFIDGHSLARELQRGPMPLSTVDAVVLQVGGSLKEAHQRGVVHRDLKPENILLTRRGGYDHFVKLVDFGIARTAGGSKSAGEKLTQSGVILGTPPYMAPEQFAAEGVVDHRADLYALGVIVYEMLAGRPPFEARSPWEYGALHTAQPPPPLDGFPSAAILPAHRRAAVHRCLEKRAEDRPRRSTSSSRSSSASTTRGRCSWAARASSPSLAPRGSREPALSPTVLAPVRPADAQGSAPSPPPRPRWPFVIGLLAALTVVAAGFFVMGASTRRGRRRAPDRPTPG